MRSHGMTSLTWDRHQGHAFCYDVVDLGYNYRIDEIRSALGLVQLKKLAPQQRRRGRSDPCLLAGLNTLGIGLPFSHHRAGPAVVSHLPHPAAARRGSPGFHGRAARCRHPVQHPLPPHPHLHLLPGSVIGVQPLPRTEAAAAREVTLPLYPTMGDDVVQLVAGAVMRALQHQAIGL